MNTLVLGRIKEIDYYELKVSLVDGKTGVVKINNVSNRYKTLLEAVIEGKEPENLSVLTDMFSIGQYLPCIVKSESKTGPELSANPRDVNKNVPMHQLKSRMILYGAVDSVEDHGYTIDLGVSGLTGFLPKSECTTYVKECNCGRQLRVGGLVPLRMLEDNALGLSSGDTRSVRLTCDPSRLSQCVWPETVPVSFDCLLPGAWLEAKVHRTMDKLVVLKFQQFQCVVPKSRLPAKLANYKQGDELRVTLVGVDASTKTLSGSCLAHTMPSTKKSKHLYDSAYNSFKGVSVGDTVSNAVVRKTGKAGLTLWLPDAKLKCLVRPKQLTDDPKAKLKLKVGDSVPVRVLDVSVMDNVAFGSTRESVLGLPFLRFEDVRIGTRVTCQLIKYCKEGAVVRVTRGIRGLVPFLQLTDYPAKDPASKYSPGDSIKCRVLSCSPSERKLILTAKLKLVQSKCEPVVRPEQLQPGLLTDCFVAKLASNGILLAFYNNLRAWAPRTQLGIADSDSIDQVYYRGQVLHVRITRAAIEDKLPVASLLLDNKRPQAELDAERSRRQLARANLKLGSLCSCLIDKRSLSGLSVTIQPQKVRAFLPYAHLTDQPDYVDHIKDCQLYAVGQVIDKCVVWSAEGGVLVSAKPSLLQFAADCGDAGFSADFDSIEIGDILPGVADRQMPYGRFVQLPAGFKGLTPNKFLADEQPPFDAGRLFSAGQTVLAKVIEKNSSTNRCLLSLRARDCARPGGVDLRDSVQHVEENLRITRKLLAPRHTKGGRRVPLMPGQFVQAKSVGSGQFTLSSLPDYRAQASAEMSTGVDCSPGLEHTALVLSVCKADKTATLCVRPDVLSALKAGQLAASSLVEVDVGGFYDAEVLHRGQDFSVVSLQLPASAAKIAFMPSRMHWNESFSSASPTVGCRIGVCVQRVAEYDGCVQRIVCQRSALAQQSPTVGPSGTPGAGASLTRRKTSVGEVLRVRIVSVTNCQLNVEHVYSRTKGRIFVTELLDNPHHMSQPLQRFNVGDELDARVIGVRSDRTHVDPSRPLTGRLSQIYEFSARPSVVSRPSADFADLFKSKCASTVYVQRVEPGAKIVFVYTGVAKLASMPYVELSQDVEFLSNLPKRLKSGAALLTSPGSLSCLPPDLSITVGTPVATHVTGSSNFLFYCRLPGQRLGQMHAMDMCEERPDTVADLTHLASEKYKLGGDRRRAPILSGIVARVCELPNSGKTIYWLRPVQQPTVPDCDADVGYVMRHCVKGALVTFGCHRTAVVSVPLRLRRLLPVGRRVRCCRRDEGESAPMRLAEEELRQLTAELDERKALKARRRRSTSRSSDVEVVVEEDGEVPIVVKRVSDKSDEFLSLLRRCDIDDSEEEALMDRLESGDEMEDEQLDGDVDEATPAKRARRDSRSRADFELLVTRQPTDARHWRDYARYHSDAGRYEEARQVLERGLATVGKSGANEEEAGKWQLMDSYLLIEDAAGDEDKFAAACHRASNACQPALAERLVQLLLKRNDAEKADDVANKLRRARPRCPRSWRLQLEVKLRRGRADDARRLLFSQALPKLPKKFHLGLLCQFARLEYRYGRPADGERVLEKLIDSYPKRPDLYLLYCRCALQAKQLPKARDILAKAEAALPVGHSHLVRMGELLAEAEPDARADAVDDVALE